MTRLRIGTGGGESPTQKRELLSSKSVLRNDGAFVSVLDSCSSSNNNNNGSGGGGDN